VAAAQPAKVRQSCSATEKKIGDLLTESLNNPPPPTHTHTQKNKKEELYIQLEFA
jgi:hypothetical protein